MQESVQNLESNITMFKKVYNEILTEVILRRKSSGLTQQSLANWLNVDVRKIIELEKGNGEVGLLLNYADKFDIEIKLLFAKH